MSLADYLLAGRMTKWVVGKGESSQARDVSPVHMLVSFLSLDEIGLSSLALLLHFIEWRWEKH